MPAFALHVDSCKKLFEKFKLRRQSSQFTLVAIGSVLPDLQEFGILKSVHGRAEQFLQYLLKTDPKYAPLAIGMIMHEELDRVIDTQFVNPHMPAARELLEQYQMTSEKVALAAHYLIDHAVNCHTLENEPDILKITENMMKVSHKRAHKIAYHLTAFFGGDNEQILKAMHTFREFDLSQYLLPDDAAALYAKFFFLQQELKEKSTIGLINRVKLGLSYGKFMLSHHKHKAKQICSIAKQKFTNHGKAYLAARKAMIKRMAQLTATYALTLK